MIIAKSSIQFELCNKPSDGMKAGPIATSQTQFTQSFGADLIIDSGTLDFQVSLQGANRAQQFFLWSDKEVEVKLVMYGSNLANTFAMKLIANVPSLLSVQNVTEIYVSNSTGDQAKVSVQGAGIKV